MSQPFDDILDVCLERLRRGEPVEDCLARYPDQARELEPLLRVARLTSEATAIVPRPEFRAAARQRLLARLEQQRRPVPLRSRRPVPLIRWFGAGRPAEDATSAARPVRGRFSPYRLAPVAAALLLVFGSSGALVASAGSLPGEPLYPVKLATEQARLWATADAPSRAELHAQLADRRLAELETLLATRGVADVPAAEAAAREAERAAELAERAGSTARTAVLARVAELTTRQQQVLASVLERAPAAARPGLERALEASRRGHQQATRVLEGPARNEPTAAPTAAGSERHSPSGGPATSKPGEARPAEPGGARPPKDDRPEASGQPIEQPARPAGTGKPNDAAKPDDRDKPAEKPKADDRHGRSLDAAKPDQVLTATAKPDKLFAQPAGGDRRPDAGQPGNSGDRPGEGRAGSSANRPSDERDHGYGGEPPKPAGQDDWSRSRW